jgi:hypothetical protein
MAISSTTTNYSGRTRDLNISQNIDPTKLGPQKVGYTFGKTSSYISGVQKLLQRYIVSLFNTPMLNELRDARANNVEEATHIFNFNNYDVIQSFRDYQNANPDMPEDEQLAGAQLQSLAVNGDRLNISVKITTKTGENVPYILPVPLQ